VGNYVLPLGDHAKGHVERWSNIKRTCGLSAKTGKGKTQVEVQTKGDGGSASRGGDLGGGAIWALGGGGATSGWMRVVNGGGQNKTTIKRGGKKGAIIAGLGAGNSSCESKK